jgi:peroxin-1
LVEVPSLDSSQRAQLIHNNVFGNMLGPTTDDRIPHVIARLGKDTDGFRPKDLRIVATRIVHLDYLRHFKRQPFDPDCGQVNSEDEATQSLLKTLELDIASIIEGYQPISQQLVDIDRNCCLMDWSSIGGLCNAKQSLHDIVIHPMKFKPVYDNSPMTLPTGVLLYGPPGCGKVGAYFWCCCDSDAILHFIFISSITNAFLWFTSKFIASPLLYHFLPKRAS